MVLELSYAVDRVIPVDWIQYAIVPTIKLLEFIFPRTTISG